MYQKTYGVLFDLYGTILTSSSGQTLRAGFLELVAALKAANVPVGLVTSLGKEQVDHVIEHHQLQETFAAVVTADDVRMQKPNPECYLLGADKLFMAATDCLVFEDSMPGIMAAQQAGMRVIKVGKDNELDPSFYNVYEMINDFTEVDVEALRKIMK